MKAVLHSRLAIGGILVLWKSRRCFFIQKTFMEKNDLSFTFALYSVKIWYCHQQNSQ